MPLRRKLLWWKKRHCEKSSYPTGFELGNGENGTRCRVERESFLHGGTGFDGELSRTEDTEEDEGWGFFIAIYLTKTAQWSSDDIELLICRAAEEVLPPLTRIGFGLGLRRRNNADDAADVLHRSGHAG